MDIQTYLEQGKQALAQGSPREAAIAYAHGAQLESDNPVIHLGLAEANLGLGSYGVVQMACRRVQELQPAGGQESRLAQALLDLLDRRFERALQSVDAVISEDPGIAYAHALRSHLLRAIGQTYDANLARARAARLSYGGRFEHCFPTVEPLTPPEPAKQPAQPTILPTNTANGASRESIPTWSRPNGMQRRMIRARFMINQMPGLVTNIIVALSIIAFLLVFTGVVTLSGANPLAYVAAIFLTVSPIQLIINLISLFFVGRAVEVLFGKWRYIVIYLASGLIGILVNQYFLGALTAGMTYAVFGIFGALGGFYFINRKSLGGFGQGAFQQWLIFAVLNIVLNIAFAQGQLTLVYGLIASIVGGLIIAVLLAPRQRSNLF
ncbi:rhomboid family intramembrane serine protease [Ktedonobacter racemifer]|nr:rhomboid family intramembrane serine protease [Ktedonobacter racemifer]